MGRINQLAEKTTLNSTDVIAVDAGAGGNTNKMTGANLAGQLKTLGNYQDKLTFDSTPTASSTNPVTSGGVKTALDGKQNTLTFDSTPTAGSTNPVTSGGIATAISQSTANVYTKAETDTAIAQSLGGVKFATLVNTGSSNRIRIRNGLASSSYFVMSMDRRNGGATICAAIQIYDGTASCSVMTNGFSGTFSAALDAYGIIVTLPNTNQSITVIGNAAFTLETV